MSNSHSTIVKLPGVAVEGRPVDPGSSSQLGADLDKHVTSAERAELVSSESDVYGREVTDQISVSLEDEMRKKEEEGVTSGEKMKKKEEEVVASVEKKEENVVAPIVEKIEKEEEEGVVSVEKIEKEEVVTEDEEKQEETDEQIDGSTLYMLWIRKCPISMYSLQSCKVLFKGMSKRLLGGTQTHL